MRRLTGDAPTTTACTSSICWPRSQPTQIFYARGGSCHSIRVSPSTLPPAPTTITMASSTIVLPAWRATPWPAPASSNLDLNLSHDFALSKRKKEAKVISVSLNSFNALNHPNYVTYIGTISSTLFGRPVAAQPPRRMQLDVQFKF